MNVAILADKHNVASEAKEIQQALEQGEHQARILEVEKDVMASLQAMRPEICVITPRTLGSAGSLQEMLELLQIPYLGSGPEACRLSVDEQLSMFAMRRYVEASEEDVVVEPLVSFRFSPELLQTNSEALIEACEKRIPGGYPFEVQDGWQAEAQFKAQTEDQPGAQGKVKDKEGTESQGNRQGERAFSYEGLSADSLKAFTKIGTHEELAVAFASCAKTGCVVRQWVEGVRLSVAVLGTGWDAHVLPPFDKATQAPVDASVLAFDEQVAQGIRSEIERCAFEICLALGVRDFALVELVWDGAQVRFSGVETLPSLTVDSAFALACKASGLSVEGVLNHLVSL